MKRGGIPANAAPFFAPREFARRYGPDASARQAAAPSLPLRSLRARHALTAPRLPPPQHGAIAVPPSPPRSRAGLCFTRRIPALPGHPPT
jgi:hypothetical protein